MHMTRGVVIIPTSFLALHHHAMFCRYMASGFLLGDRLQGPHDRAEAFKWFIAPSIQACAVE